MKATKNKQTGVISMIVKKKDPIVSHWSKPEEDAKAKAQFGRELRKGNKDAPLVKVSDRKYIRSGVADWDK